MARIYRIAVAVLISIICTSCADFLEIETKGGDTPVGPTKEYSVSTKHVSAAYSNGSISDVHEAALVNSKDLNEVFETQKYTATHAVSISETYGLKRSEAVALVGKTVVYNGGFALTDNCTITVSVKMTGCETVRFTTNKTTYCHKNFAVTGAVAQLEACGYTPVSLAIKSVDGNTLFSEITVKGDEDEVKIPIDIVFAEDDVVAYEFDNFRVTGKGTAALDEHKTVNGVRTGDVKVLHGTFTVQFSAGAEIVKTSTASPVLNSKTVQINGNFCHFSYTLEDENFQDSWTVSVPEIVKFAASDGSTVEYPLEGAKTVVSKSFSKIATVWSNRAALSIAGIEQAEDTQRLRIEAPAAPFIPGYETYNTKQWAVTRVYDRNANRNLVVWVYTLKNMSTGAIVAGHMVLEGTASTTELPQQLQIVSSPSFTTPYSLCYNVRTSSWEYGTLRGAKKGQVNETWAYANWNNSNNQPMSVNISIDVADDVVWLEDNMSDQDGVVTITYGGRKYTIVSDRKK